MIASDSGGPRDDDELIETAEVSCPHCGEYVEIFLDAAGGPVQEYVEDCEVCCRPWQVHVRFHGAMPAVEVRTLTDE